MNTTPQALSAKSRSVRETGTHKEPFSLVNLLSHIMFTCITLAMILPFILVIAISFTKESSIVEHGYQFFPSEYSLKAYQYIFEAPTILLRAYGITIMTTVIGTLLSLLVTAMLGYVTSRRDFRYRGPTSFFIFFTMLFNGGLVPSYILIKQYLHLDNTIWSMILPFLVSPFYILVMKGFMSKVPFEIIESAKMDGAREIRIFFTIVLPLSTPALATLGLFLSFGFWNAWFPALLYIDNEKLIPIQLLLVRMLQKLEFLTSGSDFSSQFGIDVSKFPSLSARMAMAILAGGPMVCIFPFFQKYFVKGLTVGSLKG
ncbi:carbohydrate ABC transporter permease [Paenibacillus sacheonensis]|uniref:ABC transporter permease subunit n=1 Tax=Paenibacillus sacheonensis TaxID=742054 RepID=A0A7X4YWE6_9BACL|nr:carbohydrate ABC transporter permease [Paenibacillus sacheonensis]MBM7567276.1 putative aldouronate transport system permease protein [Paenibacillus sacheonensis]NBC72831.1 ABC transporter permease subunit [Paenibacillus sacheonensis]